MSKKIPSYKNILEFWFDEETIPNHFSGDKDFDELIKKNFKDIYDEARKGNLKSWQDNPESTLALIIVLDQFPRNMFRNSKEMFATDSMARELTKYAISKGFDKKLNQDQLQFLYMPLMHSEDIEDQKLSVELYEENVRKDDVTFFAKNHLEVIEKFTRFPSRNNVLGRKSTKAEIDFLNSKEKLF